MMFREEAITV